MDNIQEHSFGHKVRCEWFNYQSQQLIWAKQQHQNKIGPFIQISIKKAKLCQIYLRIQMRNSLRTTYSRQINQKPSLSTRILSIMWRTQAAMPRVPQEKRGILKLHPMNTYTSTWYRNWKIKLLVIRNLSRILKTSQAYHPPKLHEYSWKKYHNSPEDSPSPPRR
jgi:hypothetical protein